MASSSFPPPLDHHMHHTHHTHHTHNTHNTHNTHHTHHTTHHTQSSVSSTPVRSPLSVIPNSPPSSHPQHLFCPPVSSQNQQQQPQQPLQQHQQQQQQHPPQCHPHPHPPPPPPPPPPLHLHHEQFRPTANICNPLQPLCTDPSPSPPLQLPPPTTTAATTATTATTTTDATDVWLPYQQPTTTTSIHFPPHMLEKPNILSPPPNQSPTPQNTSHAPLPPVVIPPPFEDPPPDDPHSPDAHRLLLPTPLDDPPSKPESDLYNFVDFPPGLTTRFPHSASNPDRHPPDAFALADVLDIRTPAHPVNSLCMPTAFAPTPINPAPVPSPLQSLSNIAHPPNPLSPPPPPPPPPPPLANDLVEPVTSTRTGDLTKPINALGPLCFSGFYLVTLTRTLVRNKTVPMPVRMVFMTPQLHFGFTVRDVRDAKWRHIHTVQISYDSLTAAGNWLRLKLGILDEGFTFKQIKDALQKNVTEAWAEGKWGMLVGKLHEEGFLDVAQEDVVEALGSEAVAGRSAGTPRQFFNQVNCHKGAPDIRRDVDGAISARECLKMVLSQLGLDLNGCNISIAKFRDEVFPLWKHHCDYVGQHEVVGCCEFYHGGYFKKIMIHKHLYNVNACTSSYHVKDLFEGLEEVIKVWSNPTGMCVREAKCAAGLRYNVDKSFQSGIRSYSKAKFLEAAPHTASKFTSVQRQLRDRLQALVHVNMKKFSKCRHALRSLEMKSDAVVMHQRHIPDVLRTDTHLQAHASDLSLPGNGSPGTPCSPCSPGVRKRKRQDRDLLLGVTGSPSTPREQKRKHAHLSLKRKEAAEQQVKHYLEVLRADCQQQQLLIESVERHGHDCACHVTNSNTPPVA